MRVAWSSEGKYGLQITNLEDINIWLVFKAKGMNEQGGPGLKNFNTGVKTLKETKKETKWEQSEKSNNMESKNSFKK